jgi:hypothetical protein
VNPNDEIRNEILRYFYERNLSATSRFGKKGSAVKISDGRRELKATYGLSQTQVMSNLTYLIDRDWVKVIEVEKTIQVKGGTIPSTVTWYEIAAPGIDKIEGESEFQPRERYAGINITATGSNVITLGDGNVVNAQFKELHSALDKLKNEITRTGKLAESTKLDLSVDIESIKDQLAKEHPDKTMIGHLWSGVERIVNGAGLIELIYKVAPLIAGLLPK